MMNKISIGLLIALCLYVLYDGRQREEAKLQEQREMTNRSVVTPEQAREIIMKSVWEDSAIKAGRY